MKIILAIVIFLLSGFAQAWDIIGIDSVNVTATYTEPTLNADGSTVTDLDHTIMYYDVGAGPQVGNTEPAGALTGGTVKTVIFPVPVGENQEVDVPFYITAFDASGNESVQSPTITRRIDRLAPAAPE